MVNQLIQKVTIVLSAVNAITSATPLIADFCSTSRNT